MTDKKKCPQTFSGKHIFDDKNIFVSIGNDIVELKGHKKCYACGIINDLKEDDR